jgi:hypothetical protein
MSETNFDFTPDVVESAINFNLTDMTMQVLESAKKELIHFGMQISDEGDTIITRNEMITVLENILLSVSQAQELTMLIGEPLSVPLDSLDKSLTSENGPAIANALKEVISNDPRMKQIEMISTETVDEYKERVLKANAEHEKAQQEKLEKALREMFGESNDPSAD